MSMMRRERNRFAGQQIWAPTSLPTTINRVQVRGGNNPSYSEAAALPSGGVGIRKS
jgi:hypothetical protein